MCVPGQSLTLHTACSYAMPNAGESMSAPLYVCVCVTEEATSRR